MFRALLAPVLMLLVALPHGLCFCDQLHAYQPAVENCCSHQDEDEPAAPTPRPVEHDEDDERDCSCKLEQVMAGSNGSVEVERQIQSSLCSLGQSPADLGIDTATLSAPPHRLRGHEPIALILCALRI